MRDLVYDTSAWGRVEAPLVNTIQMFITNRCNKRCPGCFYEDRIGRSEFTLEEYKDKIGTYLGSVEKVILVGGEPTMHPKIKDMVSFNRDNGLRTTIYTNGFNLTQFENYDMTNLSVRIGILGLHSGEKNLAEIKPVSYPVVVTYMLTRQNVGELEETAQYAEENFDCRSFFISRIRDTANMGLYWGGTEETLSSSQYFEVCQTFMNNYSGGLKEIHILRGGEIKPAASTATHCRFLNFFPDQDMVICPLDIPNHVTSDNDRFGTRRCQKFSECLMQKMILRRK
jgi:MoaA/NifB/PqqE/SkfB family radical SAM enzyme